MARYIDADEVLKEFDELEPDECYDDEHTVWLDCRLEVINAPIANVAPIADTVRKMHTEIKERCIKGGIYPAFVARTIDQIAKELLEGKEICKNTHQKK